MKASKQTTIRSLITATVMALSLTGYASAGNTASATVRLGVVLVPTVQASLGSQPQAAAQTVQFANKGGISIATMRITAAAPSISSQVREIELSIGAEDTQAGARATAGSPLQSTQVSTVRLVQTTFVAD